MLSPILKTTLIISMAFYFIILVVFLKRKSLMLKYALLWIMAGLFLTAMIIFPDVLFGIKRILGIEGNMNALFVMVLGFILIMLMALTSIVSKQAIEVSDTDQT